jgi:F-type H+-transporting ATPase subunit epsilon
MRLRIITPLSVVVDAEAGSLRAEDESGAFGILNGHASFLTALNVCIVSWRGTPDDADGERFCAVRGGSMTVAGGSKTTVTVATREAVTGDDLATLDRMVLSRFEADADEERVEHAGALKLQLHAIRRIASRLRPGADAGRFR